MSESDWCCSELILLPGSGSGHLGILLAFLEPTCKVVLVEYKEISCKQAEQRIADIGLTNIRVVNSGIEDFVGPFDVGIGLHCWYNRLHMPAEADLSYVSHAVAC